MPSCTSAATLVVLAWAQARERVPMDEQPTLESIRQHLEETLRAIEALQQLHPEPSDPLGPGERDE
jgi:hypothetical protein